MRIAGLASGMDIDQMVKSLMQVERMPLDKLKQKKQILEWQRDDFRTLNTKLLTFRDKLANLKLTPNYRARTASSSNESLVSATVTSGASQASYSISEVKQLASAATRVNTGPISNEGEKIDPTKSLMSQKFGDQLNWDQGVIESKTINIMSDGQEIKLEGAFKTGTPSKLIATPNIKVNGQTLKVVENESDLKAGTVLVNDDGTLKFGTKVKKSDVVKLDYIVADKTVEFTVGENPVKNPVKNWSIGHNSIVSANVTVMVDGTSTTYTMGEVNQDGIAQLVFKNGDVETSVGTINPATGVITFGPELEIESDSENDSESEPDQEPKPKEIKVSVNFTQNYTHLGIQTHTSKGEVNEQIFITGNDTLNSTIRKVNESSAGVTMFFDSFSDRVTMTRKETGDFNKGVVGEDGEVEGGDEIHLSGNFLNNILKFKSSTETGGQNAIFTINGLETQRNANTFEMNGVTFTLKQVFLESDKEPATISIGNDSNQVFENIKEFVNQYNELIAEIGKKINEEKHRSYQPLTDDEREGLSEKQQEKWEEMARSGLLRGDPVLSSLLSAMRLDMSNNVGTNGLFTQLASIGIKTTANYLEGGKLEIDEAKLKAALEQDPESVENLFRGTGTGSDGVVHKLYDTVDAAMKKLQEKAGRATSTNQQFTIGREMLNVDKGIDRFGQRLKLTEERYWRQFTAMEKAIQRSNDQSMFLMQQFFNNG